MKSIILFCFFWIMQSFAQQLTLVQFEQIDSLQRVKPRKIIVYIHTDWCKFCHTMKFTTLKNKEIVKIINDSFYFIDFNAEEKRTIFFNNQTFRFKPTGNNIGIHELAIVLGTANNHRINYAMCIGRKK